MYPKKDGIFTSFSSAIAFTMKFGAFPMYVFAPMKTEPVEIAASSFADSGSRPAFRYKPRGARRPEDRRRSREREIGRRIVQHARERA